MTKTSKTDWARLEASKDADIDFSDVPALSEEFLQNAELRSPPKQAVTMRLDADIVTWFKEQGQGYQTRINKLLRAYMFEQQKRGK